MNNRQQGLLAAIKSSEGKWVEFGVVEQRYATSGSREKQDFDTLVHERKHRALGPATHTSSWIISNKTLVSLYKRGLVLREMRPATGAWSGWHPIEISWWTIAPSPGFSKPPWNSRLSWADSELNFSYVPGWQSRK